MKEILNWLSATHSLVNRIVVGNADNVSFNLKRNYIFNGKSNTKKDSRKVICLILIIFNIFSRLWGMFLRLWQVEQITIKSIKIPFSKEYLLRLEELNEFDTEMLSTEIIKYLLFFSIDVNNCIAMCFDG